MKKLSLLCCLLLGCFIARAQTDLAKLRSGIKNIYGEWTTQFNNSKGAVNTDNLTETVYISRIKLEGSLDSSNLIHFIKDRQTWSFTVHFEKEKISAATLDSLIRAISFSFGKLKSIATNTSWETGYVPANKKGASDRLRSFYFLVFDRSKQPGDKTNGLISLVMGEEEYFWNK